MIYVIAYMLCVCLSITSQYYIKMAKWILIVFGVFSLTTLF